VNLLERLPRSTQDLDSPTAIRLVKVPWVGSLAYLHVIYKPAADEIVTIAARELDFPASLREFYTSCNGADLFSGAIRIYGCVAPGTLLTRSDPFSLPPLSIVETNREIVGTKRTRDRTCIASYGYDRSLVCIDNTKETITCHQGENLDVERKSWPNIEGWLSEELQRLAFLFSPEGKRLMAGEFLLPGSKDMKRQ
jgi:hypothetical protein